MTSATSTAAARASLALAKASAAHAATKSPWARFRARLVVLACEGRLAAARLLAAVAATPAEMVAALRALPGVQKANLWTSVPGKERIYVDLDKVNGGASWNQGRGLGLYVELATRRIVEVGTWAGSATHSRHHDLGTLAAVAAIIAA